MMRSSNLQAIGCIITKVYIYKFLNGITLFLFCVVLFGCYQSNSYRNYPTRPKKETVVPKVLELPYDKAMVKLNKSKLTGKVN